MIPPVTGITPMTSAHVGYASGGGAAAGSGFGTLLSQTFGLPEATAASQSQAFALGQSNVTVAQAVSSATSANLAAEEANLLISKALEGYQSIMSMQV